VKHSLYEHPSGNAKEAWEPLGEDYEPKPSPETISALDQFHAETLKKRSKSNMF
jgi:hypothetical protein